MLAQGQASPFARFFDIDWESRVLDFPPPFSSDREDGEKTVVEPSEAIDLPALPLPWTVLLSE